VSPPCPGAVVSAGHLGNTGARGLPMTITALTDAQLIEQARGGDEAAFTELYVRHQPAALRLASTYRRLGDPDELVNGAFERVLGAIKRGAGPTDSFRPYLFVTLRRFAAEKASKPGEESLDDVPEPIADAADSPALAQADRALITEAFESLPERWQAVLWHTAVEGQQPKELAGVLGVSANAAAAMAYRAREKLRQAYLQAHLMASPAPDHQPYRSQLGAFVRGGLSARDTAAVDQHLEGCESCRALLAELEDVNRTLARARQRPGDGSARQGPATGPDGRQHRRHRRRDRRHGGDGVGGGPPGHGAAQLGGGRGGPRHVGRRWLVLAWGGRCRLAVR
jgi:RNA polymerase sigma factor (sigma-70 family)